MINKNIYSEDECLKTETLSNESPSMKVNLKEGLSFVEEQKLLESEKKTLRVVKNLNEFLNFSSSNRTKNDYPQKEDVKLGINDSCSDDFTDFYPMSTAMTKELKQEIESLNRQVRARIYRLSQH